jgi:hypothetical protein
MVRHVAHKRRMRNAYKLWSENKGKDYLSDIGIDRYFLNQYYRNMMEGYRLDSSCSEQGALYGSCEYGSDPSGSIGHRIS